MAEILSINEAIEALKDDDVANRYAQGNKKTKSGGEVKWQSLLIHIH